jgi:hypothetical protein
MDTLDKGMIQVLGRMEWEVQDFYHSIQNGAQYKNYELFLEFSI